ncbi:hypothetical protein [Enterococcus sp. 2201sp1_2201st1_B8_2201SCRN_220225]|uniref:hypothetical protein n=1 Tax=unclassified Enterococcus TaxID=2608891 RepID=UPI0034A32B50
MGNLLISLALAGICVYFKQFPKLVRLILLGVGILICGGFSKMFGYGIFMVLVEGNGFSGMLALVFSLFFGGLLGCLFQFIHILHPLSLGWSKIFHSMTCALFFIFFLGFFVLNALNAFAPLPLWRRLGFFVIGAVGMIGCSFKIKNIFG